MGDRSLDEMRRQLAAPHSHPDLATLQQHSALTVQWLLHHFATLPEQPIGLTASRPEMDARLKEAAPEAGRDFGEVLKEFEEKIAPFAFRVNHPRFLAFIPSAPNFVSVLGDMLCAGTNFFAGVWLEACGPAEVELLVLDWFRQLLGMPQDTSGILTSGGSEANLTALVAAREQLSFADRGRAVVYLSELRHLSIDRAARIIGLRLEQLRPVAADEQFRLSAAPLAEAIARDRREGLLPWMVVANAGATNTGTVDPMPPLAELCRREQVWLHVDAAYGWPAVLTPEGKKDLNGIALADSVTLDPHKWFAQPFEAGCVLIREGRRLADAFALRPDYMQDVIPNEDEVNFSDHGLALTRRFRALKIWFSVKVLGLGWFRELVWRCCRLAEFAQALLERNPDFEILCPRQLSIVCFRYRPAGRSPPQEALDQLNLELIEALRLTGRAFISSTRLRGRVALRFCFINWRTTAADVEEIVNLLTAKAPRGG